MKNILLITLALLFISTAIVFSSFTKTNQKTNTDDLPQLAIEGKKFGLRDAKTGKLITEIKYDYIGSRSFHDIGLFHQNQSWFKSGYELVKIGDKWGVIDKNGKETVAPIYEDMGSESEGFVAAKLDGKWGVLNLEGKQITPFKYYEIREFKEGRAAVGKVQDSSKKETVLKYRLTEEEIAMGFKAEDLNLHVPNKYIDIYPALWGFIDTNGKEITPLKYTEVREFSEGMAAVAIMDSVMREVSIIANPLTEEEIAMGFTDKDIATYETRKIYKLVWGFMDKENKEVISPSYDNITDFKNGKARLYGSMEIKKEKLEINYEPIKSAILTKNGIINIVYTNELRLENRWNGLDEKEKIKSSIDNGAIDFKQTLIVINEVYKEDGFYKYRFGFINEMDKLVIPIKYDEVVSDFKYQNAIVRKDTMINENELKRYYLIDREDRVIREFDKDIKIYSRNEFGICFTKGEYPNKKYGFMSNLFKEIFPPIYEEDIYFRNETTLLKLNNKYALANQKGKILSDFVYEKLDWTYQNCFKAKIEEQEFYINNQNECIGNCPDEVFLKKHNIKQAKFKN